MAVLIVVGLLGQDPRISNEGADAVCNFSVADNEKFTDRAGVEQSKTTWYRVACWGKQAENAYKYLKKGSRVGVQGKLLADANGNPRIWQGNDGSARANYEMRADVVRFMGQGGNGNGGPPAEQEEDEIPF